MGQRLDAVAGFGQLIAGYAPDRQDWTDPRLLGWSDLVATAIWPALPEKSRARHTAALEGFAVAHALNTERNAEILVQLEQVAARLNAIDIDPIVLKGAAHLATGLWPTPGSRLVADIDLLVAEDEIEAAFSTLEEWAGRGPQDRGAPGDTVNGKHLPPLFDAGGPAPVELHHALFSGPAHRLMPSREIRSRSARIALGAAHARIASPTDRVLHAMLHGPAGSGTYLAPRLHLRDLLDIHFLAQAYPADIDWGWIEERLATRGWGSVPEITNRCLSRFTGMAPPFRQGGLWARLDAARWGWQLDRPAGWRAGMIANLTVHAARGLAAGGAARRQVLADLTSRATYRRVFRRYILGRPD